MKRRIYWSNELANRKHAWTKLTCFAHDKVGKFSDLHWEVELGTEANYQVRGRWDWNAGRRGVGCHQSFANDFIASSDIFDGCVIIRNRADFFESTWYSFFTTSLKTIKIFVSNLNQKNRWSTSYKRYKDGKKLLVIIKFLITTL